MSRTSLASLAFAACVLVLAACSGAPTPAVVQSDISRLADVKSMFAPEFKVSTVAPTGIDPRLLAPQTLPPGVTFDPPDCGKFATGLALPPGLKGNMSAVTAEGAGNRFIVDRRRDVGGSGDSRAWGQLPQGRVRRARGAWSRRADGHARDRRGEDAGHPPVRANGHPRQARQRRALQLRRKLRVVSGDRHREPVGGAERPRSAGRHAAGP